MRYCTAVCYLRSFYPGEIKSDRLVNFGHVPGYLFRHRGCKYCNMRIECFLQSPDSRATHDQVAHIIRAYTKDFFTVRPVRHAYCWFKMHSAASSMLLQVVVGVRSSPVTHSVSLPLLMSIVLQPARLPASTSFKMSPIIHDSLRSI